MEGPVLEARLLGPFQISIDGRPVDRWERPTARRLLQFLLLEPGRPAPRDEVIEALFPTLDAGAGAGALAKAISMARASVGRDLIESTRSYVRLAYPVRTDLERALAAHEAALQARGDERIPALSKAIAIEGELVPEERYADWPEPVRSRLAELRRRCRVELARATAAERPSGE